ncbi:hypothetical protein [Propionimicrobium sp. BV2F7]|uniref:hypothetical protein n=1 Tax=Propionimicrobium sp. BV2F7 TaxID=1111131 RepID=UPI0003D79AB2|nr:hypothetical protein [Propionimicrobium sp. BV2F7]ETJ98038.1 hypothetical protein HMPREF1255_1440 [Propionimicrobium sp. BV2F7]
MSRPENIRKLREASDAYLQALETQIKAHLGAAEALGGICDATSGLLAAQLDWADPTEGDYPCAQEDASTESDAVEPLLVGLEDARGQLAELSRAGLTSKIKELIAAHGKTRLSELSLEQVNQVLVAAREAANGAG